MERELFHFSLIDGPVREGGEHHAILKFVRKKNVQLSFCCPTWKDTSFEKNNIIKYDA
jgi:hypothetical protein